MVGGVGRVPPIKTAERAWVRTWHVPVSVLGRVLFISCRVALVGEANRLELLEALRVLLAVVLPHLEHVAGDALEQHGQVLFPLAFFLTLLTHGEETGNK